MKNRWLIYPSFLLLTTFTVGRMTNQAHATQSSTLNGDPAHPAHGSHWVETRLYFGLDRVELDSKSDVRTDPADLNRTGSASAQRITEAGWIDFLDKEVTPRFPAGLSVIDCYGQWLGKNMSTPARLRSKILVIVYPDTSDNRVKIESIRTSWKQRTGDQSVLSVSQPAEVSF